MSMTPWRYGVKVPEGSPWEGYAQELKSVTLTTGCLPIFEDQFKTFFKTF